MKRIAIDVDQVMADIMKRCLVLYNAEFNRQLTPEDFHGKNVFQVIEAQHQARVREYLDDVGFYKEIECIAGAPETVRDLCGRYEVFVATSAMDQPSSFVSKYEWLRRHFPWVPPNRLVFCGDKSILAADYLIDDNIRHLTNFRGEGILYTAHHNVHETRFRRVKNWDEVRDMFLS